MGWSSFGQRSSKGTLVLIRKDRKYIQRQERQKKQKRQEKNWLTKHESYILVRDAWALSRFVYCIFVFVFLHLSFLISAGPLSTVYLFLRLTVPLDPSPDLVLQPFQHLPTHSKSCKRKLTFVSPHLIRGLDHYIRRDNYFPIFCLWRGASLTGIKCLQSTAFFGTFFCIWFCLAGGRGGIHAEDNFIALRERERLLTLIRLQSIFVLLFQFHLILISCIGINVLTLTANIPRKKDDAM